MLGSVTASEERFAVGRFVECQAGIVMVVGMLSIALVVEWVANELQ